MLFLSLAMILPAAIRQYRIGRRQPPREPAVIRAQTRIIVLVTDGVLVAVYIGSIVANLAQGVILDLQTLLIVGGIFVGTGVFVDGLITGSGYLAVRRSERYHRHLRDNRAAHRQRQRHRQHKTAGSHDSKMQHRSDDVVDE